MFESIFVYTITALLLYALASSLAIRDAYSKRVCHQQVHFGSIEVVISILLFGFIAGARYNVGVDHLTYLSEYLSIQNVGYTVRDTFEIGFLSIMRLFASSGLHYFFFFAFCGMVQIFFIYYALKDRKFLLPYIALNIMLGAYFLDWMNGIRQCIVICLFVFLVKFIIEKNFIKYALGILIASTIHRSAWILLPVYFLFIKEYSLSNRNFNICILLACVVAGMTPSWLSIVTQVEGLLSLLDYDFYAENIELMVEENLRQTAWGPSRIGIFTIDILLILFYPKVKNEFKCDKYLSVYFILFFIGTCWYNLFVNTSHIFLRPVSYFTIFRLPLTAYLLYYLKQKREWVMFSSVCLLVFTYIYFIIYKSVYMPVKISDTNLYRFFFEMQPI